MTYRKNLKILFIPRWYPNRIDNLKGIFIKRHAIAVALKHQVAVLYVNADPKMKDKMYDSEFSAEDGISTVRVYYNNSFPDIRFISSVIKFFRYLKSCMLGIKIINEKFGTPDISHIHVLARTFFPAYYYKFFYKIPYIITEHWSGYLPEDGAYKGFFKKIITKISVRKASAITTVNTSLKQAMLSHGLNNEYYVIPNVVDINLFNTALAKKERNKFFLLTVADLDDRVKNISGSIHVIKKISEQRKDFEYHIIGDGCDMEKLKNLALKNNLLNMFVFFEGEKKSSEVAEVMRKADLFILFSNYDNMPCVMTEAFASGVPVIGSDIHGMKEHIKEGLGILVPPGNENELLDAVQSAMNTIDSFDKNKLRQYAIDNFSYETVSKSFDEIYQKVI